MDVPLGAFSSPWKALKAAPKGAVLFEFLADGAVRIDIVVRSLSTCETCRYPGTMGGCNGCYSVRCDCQPLGEDFYDL